jgi:hypothetical protein
VSYISTVVPAGYARYLIRMGGVPAFVIDVPSQGPFAAVGLAHRWLLGEALPESVKVWTL